MLPDDITNIYFSQTLLHFPLHYWSLYVYCFCSHNFVYYPVQLINSINSIQHVLEV
jgi:hypothetical protein